MLMRRLGKTELMVSAISYGCIKLPQIDEELASECLNLALDLGINYFDTARNYKDSEEKIGKAIAGRRDEFHIATKTTDRTADGLKAELDASLTNLRVDCIDVYQLHSVSDEAGWQQAMGPGGALEAARMAQDEGTVKHVGVTIHRSLPVMRAAIESGEFETVMLTYSLLDQEGVGVEMLPLAREKDMGVVAMKALSGGALAMPEEQRPDGGDPIARDSLRYVLGNENVSIAIPGMMAAREVRENCAVGASYEPLTADEERVLLERAAPLKTGFRYDQFCFTCGYCQPCPNEVPVPEVFRALTMQRAYPDSLKHLGQELYGTLAVQPGACTECRVCIEKCPAGIDIPVMLGEAMEELGGASPAS